MADPADQKPERDLTRLLELLEPEIMPGNFVFVEPPAGRLPEQEILASVREPEGSSAVVRQKSADDLGLDYDFVAGWIVLRVRSALDAVGLTAAVSACLAEHGISCNVVAGLRHDHLLVPADRIDEAMESLRSLSAGSSGPGGPSEAA
jgi:hypothetical protein